MKFSALQSPEFRTYFIGSVAAINAMWILRVVIIWLAWALTNSSSFVGLVASLSLLPTILVGPLFGVWIDRTNIRLAAYATNSGMIIITLVLLMLNLSGSMTPAILLAIAVTVGIVSAVHHPVRLSLAPRLVAPAKVASVVSLASLNFNVARIIGPFLGGILIELSGISAALCVTLVLYMPNMVLIAFLKPRTIDVNMKEPFARAFVAGLAYVRQRPSIQTALILSAIMGMFARGMMELLPIVADGIFALGAAGLGQLTAVIGAGSLAAAFIKAMEDGALPVLNPRALTAAFVGTACLTPFGLSPLWIVTLASAAGLGFCTTYIGVSLQTSIQSNLPDEMRGRVMSLWIVVAMSSTAIGALVWGGLSDLIGFAATAFSASLIGILALVWLIKYHPKRT